MSDLALFTERQSFRQWWLWAILVLVNGIFLYAIVVQIIGGQPVGDHPATDRGLIAMFGLMLVATWFLASLRLDTRMTDEAIMIRFFPLHRKWRSYAWSDIRSAEVRQYSPIMEFGGWGLRFSLSGKGTAYNVAGNKGLQLVLHKGKKILIGTQKPEEMEEALKRIEGLRGDRV
jgi:hypothetical protein